jgi:hypothetical protein
VHYIPRTGEGAGHVHALNATTGTLLWDYQLWCPVGTLHITLLKAIPVPHTSCLSVGPCYATAAPVVLNGSLLVWGDLSPLTTVKVSQHSQLSF